MKALMKAEIAIEELETIIKYGLQEGYEENLADIVKFIKHLTDCELGKFQEMEWAIELVEGLKENNVYKENYAHWDKVCNELAALLQYFYSIKYERDKYKKIVDEITKSIKSKR